MFLLTFLTILSRNHGNLVNTNNLARSVKQITYSRSNMFKYKVKRLGIIYS